MPGSLCFSRQKGPPFSDLGPPRAVKTDGPALDSPFREERQPLITLSYEQGERGVTLHSRYSRRFAVGGPQRDRGQRGREGAPGPGSMVNHIRMSPGLQVFLGIQSERW